MTDLLKDLEAQGKWLRQAAAEIAAEGHAGWGNTCLQAAEALDTHHAEIADMAKRLEAAQVVVTKNAAGQIVAVTRQDSEGRIVEVIAEAAQVDFPECSGNPASCPENEGFGCCAEHAKPITLSTAEPVTMTLDDVLEQSGAMLGNNMLPTADQLVAWRTAIAAHLAGMGEPVAWLGRYIPAEHQGGDDERQTGYIHGWNACRSDVIRRVFAEPESFTPPIDLAAVREVIGDLRDYGDYADRKKLGEMADKLEAAIKGMA